ncbi:MAG TPA: RdgB/HAM1 family non-canonical purine NTP pyrophosphatase [Actinomycetota bacterium]
MKTPLEIVVASTNEAKIAEIAEIMAPLPVVLRTRADFPTWPEVEETGATYLDNALLKAHAILEHTGLAALADDSGIEVDALDGRPGPRSARLAGPDATDEANNVRLISLLHGVPPERRGARYRCVVVLLLPQGADGADRAGGGLLVAEAACEGVIALEPRGTGGFGYDPWFVPAGERRAMAELTPAEKHAISHRGKALRALAAQLGSVLAGEG